MKVINRRAKYDYQLLEKTEAGLVLAGAEVKSIKDGNIKLEESFVRLTDNGAVLVNAYIPPYRFADSRDYEPRRSRKLLLHKKELLSLAQKVENKGLTLVPTACYTKKGIIKLEIALARGKKSWDKREQIKMKDLERETQRELRGKS